MSKTVIKIVADSLRASGHSGLVAPEGACGCELDDLQPCGQDFAQCMPGYKHMDPQRPGEWGIFLKPEPPTQEQFDNLGSGV
jgi:hypothetical protein